MRIINEYENITNIEKFVFRKTDIEVYVYLKWTQYNI